MSKLGTIKAVADIGQVVVTTFSTMFDRVRKLTDLDGRIKKLEEEVFVKEKK